MATYHKLIYSFKPAFIKFHMNTKFTSRFNILCTYRTATKSKHYSYRTENRFKSVLHFDRLVDNTVITLSGIHEERKTKAEKQEHSLKLRPEQKLSKLPDIYRPDNRALTTKAIQAS